MYRNHNHNFMSQRRKLDLKTERAIDEFLNTFFYRRMFRTRYNAVDADTVQLKGVDCVVGRMLIDNKAMSSPKYINNPKDTYSLELLAYSSRQQRDYVGWFINPELNTTHYLFVWVHDADVEPGEHITSRYQIRRLEVMLVNRADLHEYISQKCSDEKLLAYCQQIREQSLRAMNLVEFADEEEPPFLCASGQFQESPCNLIVPKAILKRFASRHCWVTPKEFINI